MNKTLKLLTLALLLAPAALGAQVAKDNALVENTFGKLKKN